MAAVRVALCFLTLLVASSRHIHGKPFFGSMFCDFFCAEYEDGEDPNISSTTTMEDVMSDAFFDPCSSCPVSQPGRTTTTTTLTPPPPPMSPFNVVLPPSPVGVNLTMLNDGVSWLVNFLPWVAGAAAGPATGSAAGPAAATPDAAATPAPAAAPAVNATANATAPAA